jgi:Transposase DDE domain
MFSFIFNQFVKESPVCVIARAAMERVLNKDLLNQWFNRSAKEQYTRELLFSSVFDIMSQVVHGSRRSVNAAYQHAKDHIGVSITSLYNKLNGIEAHTSAELVRYAAGQVIPVIEELGVMNVSALPGYRIKLLDGNCIEKSQHRIKELRQIAAGPLPGKSLVVYDAALGIPVDVFPCEDGHAQERSLLSAVLKTVIAADVWIADRNFCTVDFTCGIVSREAHFIIREHQKYPFRPVGEEIYIGETETGSVYEQLISVVDQNGNEHIFRRCRLKLKKETRDGNSEIHIISSLPQEVADAMTICDLYKTRWTIETAFQEITEHLKSEINTLGYPRAALFGFCVALVSYMILSVVKAAIGAVHGTDTVKNKVSGYYLADEISGTYRGMMIAVPSEWAIFASMSILEFVEALKTFALQVNISRYRKHTRGPKKPVTKRVLNRKSPHVSTAKILASRNK